MTNQAPDATQQQFAAVFHAPVPFLLACAVAFAFMWFMLNWRFAAKIDRITDERDHYKSLHERDLTKAPAVKPATKPNIGTKAVHELVEQSLHPEKNISRISDLGGLDKIALLDNEDVSVAIQLMDSVVGKTEIKAQDITRHALGQPLTVSGSVFQVGNILDKVSVSIQLKESSKRSIFMIFEDDLDRIRRLDKGQIIEVTGVVTSVEPNQIRMGQCSLNM